jgi:hypothetical protein
MSRTAAEAVVRYFRGDSSQPTADSQQLEPSAEAVSDQVDVAEDAAAAELEVIASEEEATGDAVNDEEE